MAYWMGMLCYRTFKSERISGGRGDSLDAFIVFKEVLIIQAAVVDELSPTTAQYIKEMKYFGEEERSESTPLDWKIERPEHLRSQRRISSSSRRGSKRPKQPILSDVAMGKVISLNDAEKGILPIETKNTEELLTRPVLNVIWEPTKEDQVLDTQPVLVNLYYEPGEGESVEISKTGEDFPSVSEETAIAPSTDVVPSVSLTTTKKRTRVSEPSPGYTKKVTETITTTKEIRRAQPMSTPEGEEGQIKSKSPEKPKEKKKRVGKVLALSSETIGEQIKKTNFKSGKPTKVYTVPVPQIPANCPREPVVLMTPQATQRETPTPSTADRMMTKSFTGSEKLSPGLSDIKADNLSEDMTQASDSATAR
ncbi:unnamed protein product [Strongylus vulgaris]|uniref:Uncharacterized protein n=1 Tax=Strongylus vulgaris TaxID=40348 RepID=A0A3P7J5B5_STRVU|nr:unnamed protein product [Strongylus vulgaris]